MISLGSVILTDPAGEHLSLPVRIYATEHQMFLQPAGYGEPEAEDGTGFPLFLDLFSDQLRIVAFPNIDSPEPVIIPLNGARESLRRSEPDRNYHSQNKGPFTMQDTNQSEPRAASSLGEETLEQTLARWERQEEEARATAATKLTEILDRIGHDVPQRKYLVAGYNGCGDEGCVEYLGFVENEEEAENAHPWNPPESLDTGLPEDFDQRHLEDLLSHFIPSGFENNEGGQGVVRINIETGEVDVDHAHNVTEVVSEPRSFQLTGRRGGLDAMAGAAPIEQDRGES